MGEEPGRSARVDREGHHDRTEGRTGLTAQRSSNIMDNVILKSAVKFAEQRHPFNFALTVVRATACATGGVFDALKVPAAGVVMRSSIRLQSSAQKA
jgi:hypothetical protein